MESVEVVDCTQAHTMEMLDHVDVSGMISDYPGATSTEWALTDEQCNGHYTQAMGAPFTSGSAWRLMNLVPSSQTWAEGEKSVQCVITHSSMSPWTGSALEGGAEAPQ